MKPSTTSSRTCRRIYTSCGTECRRGPITRRRSSRCRFPRHREARESWECPRSVTVSRKPWSNFSSSPSWTRSSIRTLMGTSNNVRGHKFELGPVFDCIPGLLFPPTASVGTLQTTPPSSCRGEPFQRHQAAKVVGQVLQADLGARPHDADRSHDPTAWRVLLCSEHMLDARAYPALGVVHSHLR